MVTDTKYFIGIDLHRSIIQVCVLDERGETVEEQRFRGDTLDEGLEVVGFLRRWRQTGRYAVEAVSMNRWLVNACREAGMEIIVADPTKLQLKGSCRKTDRRDAYEIARRLLLGDLDRNASTYFPTEEEYGTRKLVRTRHRLVSIRQQIINQLRGLLNAYRVPGPTGPLYTQKSMRVLLSCEFPRQELKSCIDALVASLWATQEAIRNLTKEVVMKALAPQAAAMCSLPDMGPQTAVTLIHELGDVHRFKGSRAVASYAGLVPRVMNSAETIRHGRLTKRGNPEIRWIIGQWAVRLLARNPQARSWAEPRLRKQHKNKVRTALARRLLVGVYIMLRRGEVFSLERCLAAHGAR
jgi:transposase